MLRKFIRSFYAKPEKVKPQICITEEGLQVVCGKEAIGLIFWSEITQIIAYKYDNFSYDEICVGFVPKNKSDPWLEISEEWEGFLRAKEKMEEMFPSINKEWLGEIMVPAFERKETVLYEFSS